MSLFGGLMTETGIARIFWASSSLKFAFNLWIFQDERLSDISRLTQKTSSSWVGLTFSGDRYETGIHLSNLHNISFPFPQCHLTPLSRIYLDQYKLRHSQEELFLVLVSKKRVIRKVPSLRTRARREFSLDKMCHACLAKRAMLKASKSQKLMPPFAFGS